MVEVGNIYYLMYVCICFTFVILTSFILKKLNRKTQENILFIISLLAFILHFVKQFVYQDIMQLHKSTAENICALSTLILPIMILSKKSVFKDFVYFICFLGGLLAILYPTEALNKEVFCFEVIRYYSCHIVLFSIPALSIILNIYKPDIKSLPHIPFCFLIYESIIAINALFLAYAEMYVVEGYSKLELFLSNEFINNSFAFGPTNDMGFAGEAIKFLIPNFMKYNFNDHIYYWPVLSMLVPSIIVFSPLYFIFVKGLRKNK